MPALFLCALSALVDSVGDVQPYDVRRESDEEYAEQQNKRDGDDYRARLSYRAEEQIADGAADCAAPAELRSAAVERGYVKAAALTHIGAAFAEECGEERDEKEGEYYLVPHRLILSVLLPEKRADKDKQRH